MNMKASPLPDSNQETLEDLMRTAGRAAKIPMFSLIFASCSGWDEEKENINLTKSHAKGQGLEPLDINLWESMPIDNLYSTIQRRLKSSFQENPPSPLLIQITGLEISIWLDKYERTPAILQTLNLNRESFWENFPFPIVIWLPDYALTKLANTAPDFWAIRSGSYTFSSEKSENFYGNTFPFHDKEMDLVSWQGRLAQSSRMERYLDMFEERQKKQDVPFFQVKLQLGKNYFFTERFSKAKECFEVILDSGVEEKKLLGETHNYLGLVYSELENFKKAEEHMIKYLEQSQKQKDREVEAIAYNHLGLFFHRKGEYSQAEKYYRNALEINQTLGKRQNEGDTWGNLGISFLKSGRVKEAVEAHEKALQISIELGNTQNWGKELGNLGKQSEVESLGITPEIVKKFQEEEGL